MQRMFYVDQWLGAGGQRFGNDRGALLPYIGSGIGHHALRRFMIVRYQVNAMRRPVVANQAHIAMRAPDLYRGSFLSFAFMTIGIEIIEAALHVRDNTIAMVHQQHGVVFGLHFYFSFVIYSSFGGNY